MQITQCKECGHENPKKFMSYEYTSHAPNCPQDIKQITDDWSKQAKELSECEDIKQIAKKEFLEPEIGVYWNTTAEESVDFWFKVISLAVEQEKERVLKQVEKGVHDVIWKEDGGLKSHDISYIVSSVMHYLMGLINNK